MSTAMSLIGYYHWFHREWMRAGLVVAVFLFIYLTVLVAPTNLALYAMLLCAPLYMLHETEEYLFPGGFIEFANRDLYKQDPEGGMLDESLVYWINMGYIWLPLPICGLLATHDLRLAAWMPYFLIFQAIVHIVLSVITRRWYNPGLATACLLHIPFAVWAIYLLREAGVIQIIYFNIYLLIGFIFILGLPIVGIWGLRRYQNRISGL
ncbi:HXXEE domain-containing protein [Synechocystis salina LEGE 06155]|nr:HXXEE domain-containing protein [Synechocystis salina LEGE 06155]